MLSALDLAHRIEAGELNPAAVLDKCAEVISAREEEIGAFIALDLDAARRRAEDPAVATGPLRGLPVGVKDILDTVDFPTGYGTTFHHGHKAASDAALVAMIRRTGGNIVGKTVTTELAHLRPGKTRNPHNPAHTPGGSSSGSAAAVAAGMLPVAVGSQTGGSVIRPAAYCGVAGFKPSYKLLPTAGMKCFSWHLDTAGLFAAGVADVAFAAAAITGRDLRVDQGTPAAPKILFLRTHIWNDASEDMRRAVETTARAAEAAGAKVSDVDMPQILQDAWDAHGTVQDYEAYRALAWEYDNHRDELGPLLRGLLDAAASIDADTYDAARRITKRARQALGDLMNGADVILTPSAPSAAPASLASTGPATFNRLWTLMGTPCVNIPGLRDDTGLPLGVQVVGRFGQDRGALEAARFVELALARRNA